LRANPAQKTLEGIDAHSPADHARLALAWQLLGDLRRIDEQRRETKKHMTLAVKASATIVTEVFGVGPFVACAVKGHVGDISRFASRAAFAAYNGTAPVEVSSGEKKGPPGCPGEGTGGLTTPSTWRPSPRSTSLTVAAGPTTNANGLRARPPKKRSGP